MEKEPLNTNLETAMPTDNLEWVSAYLVAAGTEPSSVDENELKRLSMGST